MPLWAVEDVGANRVAMMDQGHRRNGIGRTGTIVVAIAVIVVVISAIALYPHPPTSRTVYCGILQYVEFPADTLVHGQTTTVIETMTTAIDYTTTTTEGPVGQIYSTTTISTGSSGYEAGVETICSYISETSAST
jgi:hypothetical protein